MAIIIPVVNPLSPTVAAAIAANVLAGHDIIDLLVIAITEAQTKAMLAVATNRESETAAIYTGIMVAFPQTMPTGLTLADFQAMRQEAIDTDSQYSNYITLANELDGHGKIVRNNLLVYAMQALDNARLLAKSNPTIAAAVKVITDQFFSKTSSTDEVAYTIGISATVTIAGVKTEKMLVNTGLTILTVLNVNGNVVDTLTIYPGSGKLVPTGWTNIVVTNMSAMEAGAFLVSKKA